MELVLFACCESTSIDASSNNLSLFNCLDGMNSPSFPVSLPPITLVVWAGRQEDEPDKVVWQTRWLLNGVKVAEIPIEVPFKDRLRARTVAKVGGLVAHEPGTLEIQLRSGRKKLGKWLIFVKEVGEPKVLEVKQEVPVAGARAKKAPRKRKAKVPKN